MLLLKRRCFNEGGEGLLLILSRTRGTQQDTEEYSITLWGSVLEGTCLSAMKLCLEGCRQSPCSSRKSQHLTLSEFRSRRPSSASLVTIRRHCNIRKFRLFFVVRWTNSSTRWEILWNFCFRNLYRRFFLHLYRYLSWRIYIYIYWNVSYSLIISWIHCQELTIYIYIYIDFLIEIH